MKASKLIGLAVILTGVFNINSAVAATRIQFARGSYCGMYSGNFTGGKEFVLRLAKGQTFTSKNVGNGTQYDIYVKGSTGVVRGEKVSTNEIQYYIPRAGNYYVYVESTVPHSSIEFCAYE